MQQLQVISTGEGHRLRRAGGVGVDMDVGLVNAFLAHLGVRCFSPATVRAYAYDLLTSCGSCWPAAPRSPMWS